jgi:hypothetical protein
MNYPGRSLPSRAVRLTFPSLPGHTVCAHATTLTPPTVRVHWMVHPPDLRAFAISCQVRLFRLAPSLASERIVSRGRSFLFMLRPARWLERLTSPRRRFRADRPARLRQSLPQPGSPPTRVCYHYSAQPPIAEAGFAPARVSKNEGCTRRKQATEILCELRCLFKARRFHAWWRTKFMKTPVRARFLSCRTWDPATALFFIGCRGRFGGLATASSEALAWKLELDDINPTGEGIGRRPAKPPCCPGRTLGHKP